MSELWSSQQHEWLTALGHTLYVQGAGEAPVAVAVAVEEPARPQRDPVQIAAPVRRKPEPETTPAARVAAPRAASRLPDKLHFALIRASGCNPNAEEAASIFAGWPPSSELRGNPGAKRALWPQLRALRRQRSP